MNRTARLNLCQWNLEDDVDLNEINGNFATLDGAMTKVAYGIYTGNGTSGSNGQCSLSVSFTPKLVMIFGNGKQAMLSPTEGTGISTGNGIAQISVSCSEGTLSWFCTGEAAQMNTTAVTYLYAAIG